MSEFDGLLEGQDPAFPNNLALQLLRGAVSYHDHYGWEKGGGQGTRCRQTYDPVLIAQSAADAGMQAVVLRNLYFTSAGDAFLVEKLVPNITVIGGIFVSTEIGGVNPTAIETALTYGKGARFVCMPTDSSAHNARRAGLSEEEIHADPLRYVTPFDASGKVKPAAREILRLVADANILVETGSMSPREILTLVEAARSEGVERILVTHPTPWFCGMSVPEMRAAADMGAYIEFTWVFYGHSISYMTRRYGKGDGTARPEDIGDALDQIQAVGPEHCVLSTDFGTLELPASRGPATVRLLPARPRHAAR